MTYPFTAIVGQEEMKLALILNLVDPLIGGVLIMGHRGTGKSTAVRALADLLPPIEVVADCPYNCDPRDPCSECLTKQKRETRSVPVPVVELPLGATEDRVCGTIDIERALASGRKVFDPGLLARANRGFLYIDEVNLLEDHLVDLLLDVAATGRNRVEREGISVEHPASFVLIGSGNPEEGDLRPQLLDRFGLHTEVVTENYLKNRVDIVVRRDAYDRDAAEFRESFAPEQQQLAKRIARARSNLRKVSVPRPVLEKIAQLCADLKVDGHRGELTIMRAARALTAFEGRKVVTEDDVRRVSAMSLRHRMRRDALDETATRDQIEQAVEEVLPQSTTAPKANNPKDTDDGDREEDSENTAGRNPASNQPSSSPSTSRNGSRPNKKDGPSPPAVENRSRETRLEDQLQPRDRKSKRTKTRRSAGAKAAMQQLRGRYMRSVEFKNNGARVAVDATLRAMVAQARSKNNGTPLTPVSSAALRYKLLKDKQGTLFIFAIDASGSMAANRIARAKTTILKLLRKSYLNRDSVAIVSFHGMTASVDLPPSRSILRARRVLDTLRMGGSTPLGAGLVTTIELIKLVGDKFGETVVLLFTDGRSNVPLRRKGLNVRALRHLKIEAELRELNFALRKTRARVIVVDTQKEFESSEETRRLAEILQAQFVKLAPAIHA
ncbi:MAG TPA: magnesium chelatase ATPase subunit I [Pyrinomonadaceae bacterium]|nr:magnesium chelatase ATPase subunit I [Pyrinomonadaceae bacterium]